MNKRIRRLYTTIADSPRLYRIAVGGVAALAMLIAWVIGSQQSVWFDEAYSVRLARQSWQQLLALTSVDTHPPLYYMILKLWGSLGQWHDGWLRLYSILCYGVSIIIGGAVVKQLFHRRVALGVMPFLLLSPLMLRYGFEIRMYAMAMLIGILATYLLVRARQRPGWSWWWCGYMLLVTAGMMTLYYMVLVWLAHAVWLLVDELRHRKAGVSWFGALRRAPWVWAYCESVLLFGLWVPVLLTQVEGTALTSVTQIMAFDNIFSVITFTTVYQPIYKMNLTVGQSVIALLAIWLVLVIIRDGYRVLRTARERRSFWLLVAYIVIPVIVLLLLSAIAPLYVERYISHVAIGGALLLGVSATLVWQRHPSSRQRWMIAGLVVVLCAGTAHLAKLGNYNFQRELRPAMRQAARQLSTQHQQPIVTDDPYVGMELLHYVPERQVRLISDEALLTGGYAPLVQTAARLDPQLIGALPSTIWYVYYDVPTIDWQSYGYHVGAAADYGTLKVVQYQR